jgi:hypothetical protein
MIRKSGGMEQKGAKEVVGGNPVPVPLCPPEISRGLPQYTFHINLLGDSRVGT